ncbi:hypothetical protein [Salinicoccus roseus]|nr:hypothetical protein [Salinicoccus roseus]RPE53837.1 hypothetical protein EDC33_0078 [Salinicoccus roseus]GGA70547.1 hypothetical protein GCM10007176_13510 [Salinicoccus roseus]
MESRKVSIPVFIGIIIISIFMFLYNIGWVTVTTFYEDAKIGKIFMMGVGLSGIIWSFLGLMIAILGQQRFNNGIYLRMIIRGIFYTPLLSFPIVYVFINHTPETILETGILVVVVTSVVKLIIKIDEKVIGLYG